MTKHETPNPQQIHRERVLFRYSMALERGDFDTVRGILHQAEQDAELDAMLKDLDAAYEQETLMTNAQNNAGKPKDPQTLPQKPKRKPQESRWFTFPMLAAVLTLALTGLFAVLIATRNNVIDYAEVMVPLVSATASETPTATPSYTPTMMPSYTPSWTPSPIPSYTPSWTPSPVPSYTPTLTATPFIGAAGNNPPMNGFVSICEGIAQGQPQTRLFTQPFNAQGKVIGVVDANILVAINDVAVDLTSVQTWYFVSIPTAQGWANSADITLMWNCMDDLNQIWSPDMLASSSQLAATVTAIVAQSQGTPVPTLAAPTAAPLYTFTPTPLPFGGTGNNSNLMATPTPAALCSVTNTTRENLNLIADPSTGATPVGMLQPNDSALVLGITMRPGRQVWLYVEVRTPNGLTTGWLPAENFSGFGCPSPEQGSLGIFPTAAPLYTFTPTFVPR